MTGAESLYRPNVGVTLFNAAGLVWVGRRAGERGDYCWQFPQGGVDPGEDPANAALRELQEETGVSAGLVRPLGGIADWLRYDFPPEVRAGLRGARGRWRGQQQKWFAFRFLGDDGAIDLHAHPPQEFEEWRWIPLAGAPALIVPWKRPVYEAVAQEFARFATPA